MWNRKIVCKKCGIIKKYDSTSTNHTYGQMKFCSYCGQKVKHEAWSPNL